METTAARNTWCSRQMIARAAPARARVDRKKSSDFGRASCFETKRLAGFRRWGRKFRSAVTESCAARVRSTGVSTACASAHDRRARPPFGCTVQPSLSVLSARIVDYERLAVERPPSMMTPALRKFTFTTHIASTSGCSGPAAPEGRAPEHTAIRAAAITRRRDGRIGCSQIGRDDVTYCKTATLTNGWRWR